MSRRDRAAGAGAAKKTKAIKVGAKSAKSAASDARRTRKAPTVQALTGGTAAPRPPGQVTKVSISMPGLVADAVREVAGQGQFSAYVSRAVERQLELDRLAELVAGIEQTLGRPIGDRLMAEAEAAWHAE